MDAPGGSDTDGRTECSDGEGSMNANILPGLLTILFIGLKLTNNIAWSWWWVLCPLWIVFLISMVVMILALVATYVNGGRWK